MTEPTRFVESVAHGYHACHCNPADGLLLAVSGGPDSVALLHATHEIVTHRRQPATVSAPRLVVAHLDHALRPESHTDAAFVQNLADSLQVPAVIRTLAAGELEQQSQGSLEESARKARYNFLTETARTHNLNHIATAHHLDDQAETVLHQIVRGSGLRGLSGMQPIRDIADDVRIIRPLLGVRRHDILAYLEETGRRSVDDPSNQDATFTRNRIRHNLLPELRQNYNAAADTHLAGLATEATDALAALDALAARILTDALLEQQPHACRLRRSHLTAWPSEIIRHTLMVLWIQQHWPRSKMTRPHWTELTTAITTPTNTRLDLPANTQAVISEDLVRLFRE